MNSKKKIFCIGSCRSVCIPSTKYEIINFFYTHTTKETIQLINFAAYDHSKQNNMVNNNPFVFKNMNPGKCKSLKNIFKSIDTLLIEISSVKEMKDDNGYYYNQWVIRDEHQKIKKNITTTIATVDELKKDIEIIKKTINKLFPNITKIIFQSHFNLDFKGLSNEVQDSIKIPRSIIDTAIKQSNGIIRMIPKEIFTNYNWKEIVLNENDTAHLNAKGYQILAKYLDSL